MAESTANFTVADIRSEADVTHIKEELETVNGVMGTEIDADSGRAEILYDEDLISGERVKNEVRDLGFEVE